MDGAAVQDLPFGFANKTYPFSLIPGNVTSKHAIFI